MPSRPAEPGSGPASHRWPRSSRRAVSHQHCPAGIRTPSGAPGKRVTAGLPIAAGHVGTLAGAPVKLARIAEQLAPSQIVGDVQVEITDLAYDTRAVRPGTLFFCVPGSRFDGHELADRAIDAGAAALVVEHPVASRVPQLVVAGAREAMAAAATEFFGRPTEELEVVGVTGTNGKTTTAFLLYSILAAAGRRPGLLGTIESRVGGEIGRASCRERV